MYKLFMEFDNPTEDFLGKRTAAQGFSVYKDKGFVLFHTGVCAVYSLKTKNPKPVGVFKLGSYNDGVPNSQYINHANDAMFGARMEGEEYPLLYVTAGNSGNIDEKGYIAYCAVEQIRCENGVFNAKTVQRIYYKNDGIEKTNFQTPGWGWPASLVDIENGWYYMFSARYRTKKEFSRPDNVYIVTKFRLPSPDEGDVTLYPTDIVEQFELPFDVYITQGGTLKDGRIWYMFGFGGKTYPNTLRVVNLQTREYDICEDLSDTDFSNDEVECCGFFGERLLINTVNGKIYERLTQF